MASHRGISFRAFCSNLVKSSISIAILGWACANRFAAHAEDLGAGSAPEITLDEIKSRLTEWRNSFVNIRVVWELRSLPGTDHAVDEWPAPPEPDAAKLFTRQEWIWADHGLNRLEDWSFFYEDGACKVHSIDGFNAPKNMAFRAQFAKPNQEAPEKYLDLKISSAGVGKPIWHIEYDATEALYWPGFAEWLPEIFSRWRWELEKVEDVAGQPCARVAAIRDEGTQFERFEVLWLDLDHDCLVRRHRQRALSGEWLQGRDFIVDEFQQLDSGIWFPKRGRNQLYEVPYENHLFVVTDVAVNESTTRQVAKAGSCSAVPDPPKGRGVVWASVPCA